MPTIEMFDDKGQFLPPSMRKEEIERREKEIEEEGFIMKGKGKGKDGEKKGDKD